jgi:hypothetical protein
LVETDGDAAAAVREGAGFVMTCWFHAGQTPGGLWPSAEPARSRVRKSQ